MDRGRSPVAGQWSAVNSGHKVLLIGLGALLLLAFYVVSDSSYLAHDDALTGADWLGAAICHRFTDRSFNIAGRQFPLCARCSGMYLGVALTFLTLGLAGRWRRRDLPPLPLLLVLVGFVGLMAIDGLNSYSHFFPDFPHLYQPRNWLRLATGLGAGLAMGLVMFPALAQTLWQYAEPYPVIDAGRELAGLVLVAAVAMLLLLSNQPAILYVLALTSAAGVLIIVTAINSVLLLVLLRRDGRATSWRAVTVPLLTGLILAIAQLSAVSLLRFNLTGTITGFPGL